MLYLLWIITSFVGCGYSRWNFVANPDRIEGEGWEIGFAVTHLSPVLGITDADGNVLATDRRDTLFVYTIWLEEVDTTAHPRINFEVLSAALQLSSEATSISLLPARRRTGQGHGRHGITHGVTFVPFSVQLPRPNLITIDQVIAVVDAQTGTELDRIEQRVICDLTEYRGSHLMDFIEGT